jgi:hypothetical protein
MNNGLAVGYLVPAFSEKRKVGSFKKSIYQGRTACSLQLAACSF